jgi:hypothetical protein
MNLENLEERIRSAKPHYKKHRLVDEQEFTNQVISKISKANAPQNPRSLIGHRRITIGAGISAGAVLLLVGISPAMATAIYHIPKDNFVSQWFQGLGEGSKLVHSINQPVTSHGITVTLTNVLYDRGGIHVGYTVTPVQSQYPDGGVVNERSLSFTVNGKPMDLSWDGANGKAGEGYTGLIQITSVENLPKSFDLQINFDQIGTQRGDWAFSLPVSQEESNALTKTFSPSISKAYGNDLVAVEKVVIGPATTEIDFRLSVPEKDWSAWATEFWVKDDKGHPLGGEYGGLVGTPSIKNGVETGVLREMFISPTETPKYLIVSPYGSETSPLSGFEVPLAH